MKLHVLIAVIVITIQLIIRATLATEIADTVDKLVAAVYLTLIINECYMIYQQLCRSE